MNLYDLIRTVPLFTALAWLSALLLQVLRLRIRTLTERFFVLGLTFSFLYPLNDWLFMNVSIGEQPAAGALLLARLGMSYVTLAALFFLLFMKAFHSRAKQSDIVLLLPTAALLVVCWSALVTGVRPVPWGWQATFDQPLFVLWVVYALAYIVIGLRYMVHISHVLKRENPQIGKKTQRIVVLFVSILVMGALTNILFTVAGIDAPPLFSSLLIVPGGVLVMVLSPLTKDRVALFIKRWKSRAYDVQQAFLVYQNGTLIASKTEGEGTAVDKDIFAATLDAIQTFMRTSFPLLRGKWLKTIEHGDVKIVLERGQKVYLAVVIAGQENDQLRRLMRDVIQAIEVQNSATLLDWSGVPEDVKGAKAALGALFKREDVF